MTERTKERLLVDETLKERIMADEMKSREPTNDGILSEGRKVSKRRIREDIQ